MISSSDIYGAMVVVAILLVILSIPSILLTVRSSSRLLRRYRTLRSVGVNDADRIPKMILDEWSACNSTLSYISMISEEMERLNTLRPAVLQAEIAFILIVFLSVVPRFETDVLMCMIVVLIVVVISILYNRMNLKEYGMEYFTAMSQLETNGDEHHDMIYA